MAEITPIAPMHPTIRPRRIESDDKSRREQPQSQEEETTSEQKLDEDEQPQHIDERV